MRCGDSLRTGVSDLPSSRTFAFTCGMNFAALLCGSWAGETRITPSQEISRSKEYSPSRMRRPITASGTTYIPPGESTSIVGDESTNQRCHSYRSCNRRFANTAKCSNHTRKPSNVISKVYEIMTARCPSITIRTWASTSKRKWLVSTASLLNDTKHNMKPTSGSRSTIIR